MKQYLDLCNRVLAEGTWIANERTDTRCLTVINADLEYDVGNNSLPLLTTKKMAYRSAIAEILGYLKGYTSAADFRALGTRTWDANANENSAWLANPARKGEDDMGLVYGAVARNWPVIDRTSAGTLIVPGDWKVTETGLVAKNESIDTIKKVTDNLSKGIDDRGEIVTFWNPGMFNLGCLRPCMHTHQFSLLDGTLYLHSFQRSADIPLGLPFNMIQCFVLLALVAKITGHKPGKVYHKIVNAHVYENQLPLLQEQLKRQPFKAPKLWINSDIKSLDDIINWVTPDDFMITDYEHHPTIKYPFSV